MIDKETMDFLKKLRKNNNREWFNARRDLYEHALANMLDLLNFLILSIAEFDPSVSSLEAKDSLFRIYRDVRFSKDKSPYKPYFGAIISREGRKGMMPGGYYVHIEPGGSIVCGGVYQPDAALLERIRARISRRFREFKSIIGEKAFRKYFGGVDGGESLKKVPRGFNKEDPAAEFLKMRQFLAVSALDDKTVLSPALGGEIVARVKAARKFNDFLLG